MPGSGPNGDFRRSNVVLDFLVCYEVTYRPPKVKVGNERRYEVFEKIPIVVESLDVDSIPLILEVEQQDDEFYVPSGFSRCKIRKPFRYHKFQNKIFTPAHDVLSAFEYFYTKNYQKSWGKIFFDAVFSIHRDCLLKNFVSVLDEYKKSFEFYLDKSLGWQGKILSAEDIDTGRIISSTRSDVVSEFQSIADTVKIVDGRLFFACVEPFFVCSDEPCSSAWGFVDGFHVGREFRKLGFSSIIEKCSGLRMEKLLFTMSELENFFICQEQRSTQRREREPIRKKNTFFSNQEIRSVRDMVRVFEQNIYLFNFDNDFVFKTMIRDHLSVVLNYFVNPFYFSKFPIELYQYIHKLMQLNQSLDALTAEEVMIYSKYIYGLRNHLSDEFSNGGSHVFDRLNEIIRWMENIDFDLPDEF